MLSTITLGLKIPVATDVILRARCRCFNPLDRTIRLCKRGGNDLIGTNSTVCHVFPSVVPVSDPRQTLTN